MHLRERLIWSARGQRFNRLMRFGRPPILGLHSRVEHDRPCLRCEALQAFPPPALDIRSVTSRASNSTATATGEEPSKTAELALVRLDAQPLGSRVGPAALDQGMAVDQAENAIHACSGAADEGGYGWAMIRLFRCKLASSTLLACPGISRPHPFVRRPLVDVPFPPQTPVCSGHRGTGEMLTHPVWWTPAR